MSPFRSYALVGAAFGAPLRRGAQPSFARCWLIEHYSSKLWSKNYLQTKFWLLLSLIFICSSYPLLPDNFFNETLEFSYWYLKNILKLLESFDRRRNNPLKNADIEKITLQQEVNHSKNMCRKVQLKYEIYAETRKI